MIESPRQPGRQKPKTDPETLVLRGRPPQVVRFRRGTVIAIAALGSAALVGVAWLGLRPPSFRMATEASGKIEGAARPDGLANAPKSYGDVPKLGPPLPGDLGRPILAHERAATPTGPATDRSEQDAAMERQRMEAARKAARESGVMMRITRTGDAMAERGAAAMREPAGEDAPDDQSRGMELDPSKDSSAQDRKATFLRQRDTSPDLNPYQLVVPASPYTLSAGSIIAASLITGLNSDLPGLVTAQVTENAFDSATGQVLLVPQGARLIGQYDSVVAFGQSRALVAWNRIIFPDGSSIRIDNMPATDVGGYAGLSDQIDRHSWQLLKGVGLSTLLGIGTELSTGNDEGDLVSALRRSAQQSGATAGDMLVGRSLDTQPTLRVRPGWPLRIVVHRDIILKPWPAQEQVR